MKKVFKKIKLDNLFIIISILFLGTLFIVYLTRFIHFYRLEHTKFKIDEKTILSDYLIKNDPTLIKEKDKYIYKGKDVNNYLEYSGILFRIVSVKDGEIKLVTDDIMTNLVASYDKVNYKNTYLNEWLNDEFLSILKDKNKYLVKTKTCIDELDNYDVKTCNKYYKDDLVGLLSIDEYLTSDANNGYLNNGKYYWLSNQNKEGNNWYVYDVGGLSDKSKTEVDYRILGIRPTITLNKKTVLMGGSGTKENPYIIINNDNKLLINRNVGEYVSFSGYTWKIIGYDTDNNVKLVLEDKLTESVYSTKDSSYLSSTIYDYLNNEFYNSLDNKELIINHTWSNGFYNNSTKYNYKDINNESYECYIGLLNIGDIGINDADNYYLMTRYKDNIIYSIQDNKVFLDLVSKSLYIRPTIYIKGDIKVKGKGTKEEPFILEGE